MLVANVGRRRAFARSWRPCGDWHGRLLAGRRWSATRRIRRPAGRAARRRTRRPRAGRARIVARWRTGGGGGEPRDRRPRPAGAVALTAGLPCPDATTPRTGSSAAAVALAAGADPAAIRDGPGHVRRRRPSPGAEGRRGRASSSSTTTATTRRPWRRRSTRSAQRYPGRRLWAVYEPLTYHRTAAMLDAFAEVLERADRVVDRPDPRRPRPRHDDHLGGRARGGGRGARGRRPRGRRARVEETADWLATRSSRATSCS